MRCPYCKNRFSKIDLDKILSKKGSYCVCKKCEEEIHFIDLYSSYTSEKSNLIKEKTETDFINLIKDLISLNILTEFEKWPLVTLAIGHLNKNITDNPTEKNLSIVQLSVEVVKFILSKYYLDIHYANYVLELVLLAIELDFTNYEMTIALLKKENEKLDKVMEERYLKSIEISIKEASRKITWYQKLLIDSNGKFFFWPGAQNVIMNEEVLKLIGLWFWTSVLPFMKDMEITWAINFIVNCSEKLARIRKTNSSFFQKIKNLWR